MGSPFYVVIRVKRRSSCLQVKGSTFFRQLFQNPKYWSGPGDRTNDLPHCSQGLYRRGSSATYINIGTLLTIKASFELP